MNSIREMHEAAMDFADKAYSARKQGNVAAAKEALISAFELEAGAARLLSQKHEAEPTRSILFRSAVTIALDCEFVDEAEKLIHVALSGNPPTNIAEELRDLYEKVTFARHLSLRGIALGEDELQMAIAGKDIGFGIAPTDVVLNRVRSAENLMFRTVERKRNRPYREGGRIPAKIANDAQIFMTVPRAASFAITLRIGGTLQEDLPGFSFAQEVIDEVLECLKLYELGENALLKEKIPEEAYFNNFVGLANALQPDGKRVELVGFTTSRQDGAQRVALTQRREQISVAAPPIKVLEATTSEPESVNIRGTLLIANSAKRIGEIEVVSSDGKVKFKVPDGMMSDIVKPLWESEVEVTGNKKGRYLHLTQIRAAT